MFKKSKGFSSKISTLLRKNKFKKIVDVLDKTGMRMKKLQINYEPIILAKETEGQGLGKNFRKSRLNGILHTRKWETRRDCREKSLKLHRRRSECSQKVGHLPYRTW
jgi:hypothetical protein